MSSKCFVIFVEVNAGPDNPELVGFYSAGGFIESNFHMALRMDKIESRMRFNSLIANKQTRVVTEIEIAGIFSVK